MKFTLCSTILHPPVISIEGSKGIYNLNLSTPFTESHCTCQGFYYRGECRHIKEQEEKRCKWMIKGEAHPINCPLCGGSTEVWESEPEFI